MKKSDLKAQIAADLIKKGVKFKTNTKIAYKPAPKLPKGPRCLTCEGKMTLNRSAEHAVPAYHCITQGCPHYGRCTACIGLYSWLVSVDEDL